MHCNMPAAPAQARFGARLDLIRVARRALSAYFHGCSFPETGAHPRLLGDRLIREHVLPLRRKI